MNLDKWGGRMSTRIVTLISIIIIIIIIIIISSALFYENTFVGTVTLGRNTDRCATFSRVFRCAPGISDCYLITLSVTQDCKTKIG
jgi:hypothetical protein